MRIAALVLALFAAACADGGRGYGSGDEGDVDPHVVDVRPVASAVIDYVVLMRNDDDLGFDLDDPDTRRNTAIRAVRRYCQGPQVVDERQRETGLRTRYNLPIRTYEVSVRCAG